MKRFIREVSAMVAVSVIMLGIVFLMMTEPTDWLPQSVAHLEVQ